MMKFEGGYTVETVFDGSKFGMEPFSVAVSPSGELLVLDSENSNIYKISTSLSPCMFLFVRILSMPCMLHRILLIIKLVLFSK